MFAVVESHTNGEVKVWCFENIDDAVEFAKTLVEGEDEALELEEEHSTVVDGRYGTYYVNVVTCIGKQ